MYTSNAVCTQAMYTHCLCTKTNEGKINLLRHICTPKIHENVLTKKTKNLYKGRLNTSIKHKKIQITVTQIKLQKMELERYFSVVHMAAKNKKEEVFQ